jgi:hypothetical protein
MRKWVRYLICVLAVCGSARAVGGKAPQNIHSLARLGVANPLPVEVRLRRLHLVRPDLIPYPLDIEVVC